MALVSVDQEAKQVTITLESPKEAAVLAAHLGNCPYHKVFEELVDSYNLELDGELRDLVSEEFYWIFCGLDDLALEWLEVEVAD